MRKGFLLGVVVAVIGAGGALSSRTYGAAFEPGVQQVQKPDHPRGYIEEGPLPEGFPPPSEVGQIVEKSYPLCRTYSAEGNNAFMRCFAYLSKHKHEMTAPVIMDYQRGGKGGRLRPNAEVDFMDVRRMHFVLDKPSLDAPKREGSVIVGDIPKMLVLSIAFQGEMSAAKLKAAEGNLKAEIASRKDLVAAGPMRVLGYNSPMVQRDKSFWEVQIPVHKGNGDAAQ